MNEKISLQEFWDKIDHDSITHLNDYFDELAPYLVQFLVHRISREEKFAIDVYKDGWEKGSVVKYSESYKQVELRSKKSSSFELLLTISGLPGQKFVFKHRLNEEETEALPQRLRRLMYSIKELARPMTFYKGL